jgi:ribosomal protein S3AE
MKNQRDFCIKIDNIKIKDCFENFEERYKDFDYYRQVIKKEPEKFIEDMKNIFVKV